MTRQPVCNDWGDPCLTCTGGHFAWFPKYDGGGAVLECHVCRRAAHLGDGQHVKSVGIISDEPIPLRIHPSPQAQDLNANWWKKVVMSLSEPHEAIQPGQFVAQDENGNIILAGPDDTIVGQVVTVDSDRSFKIRSL